MKIFSSMSPRSDSPLRSDNLSAKRAAAQSPLRVQKTPLRDTISFSNTTSSPPLQTASPAKVLCDWFECVRYFVIAKTKKIFKFFSFIWRYFTHSSSPYEQAIRELAAPAMTEIIRTPSMDPEEEKEEENSNIEIENARFAALHLSAENVTHIDFILETLAYHDLLKMPHRELRQKGKDLEQVHPLKFLEYIVKKPNAAVIVQKIKERMYGMIWGQFVDELGEKLYEKVKDGSIKLHINAFSRSVGKDPSIVRQKILERSWSKFVDFLLEDMHAYSPESSDGSRSNSSSTSSSTPPSSPKNTLGADTKASSNTRPFPMNKQSSLPRFQGKRTLTHPTPPVVTHEISSLRRSASAPEMKDEEPGLEPEDMATKSMNISHDQPKFLLNPMEENMNIEQKKTLEKILSKISKHNHIYLGLQTISLRNMWETLKSVHSLRLVCEIFIEQKNFLNFQSILSDNWKSGYFLDDLVKILSHDTSPETLIPYAKEFSRIMNVREDAIYSYLMIGGKENWKNLILFTNNSRQLNNSQAC